MARAALSFGALIVLALLLACGGDDDDTSGGSTNPSISPAAQLPMHLRDTTPKHGEVVTNEDLAVGQSDPLTGICVAFDFRTGATMGDDPTSLVHLFLNGEDISSSLNWVVTADLPTSSGNGCYAPPEPLIAGIANMRLRYADSTGREFEYPWQFEITE